MNDSPSGAGVIIAAPSSGSGKTVVTLGLLRHLKRSGVPFASAKAGPDYIDPAFHTAASGRECLNLDVWAMRPDLLMHVATGLAKAHATVICEGVMGLFDGALLEEGSTADLAGQTGWPVVLVIDAGSQGASVGAVLGGFARHRKGFAPIGVIFNRVGSSRHADILTEAAARSVPDMKVLGHIPRQQDLDLPGRHLGLVQAIEHKDLEGFLDRAADIVSSHVDVDALVKLAGPLRDDMSGSAMDSECSIRPFGQRIAVANDEAFAFRYPLVIEGWRKAGADVSFFSPLSDEGPKANADAVYLPGGYPELHGGRLAGNMVFKNGLRSAADRGGLIFGECGGYMVLGQGLVDAGGARHEMTGLLALETSFEARQLHLGYREAVLEKEAAIGSDTIFGKPGARFRGHEFHYASILSEGPGHPLFRVRNAAGEDLGASGQAAGRVLGSFIHLIDRMD